MHEFFFDNSLSMSQFFEYLLYSYIGIDQLLIKKLINTENY